MTNDYYHLTKRSWSWEHHDQRRHLPAVRLSKPKAPTLSRWLLAGAMLCLTLTSIHVSLSPDLEDATNASSYTRRRPLVRRTPLCFPRVVAYTHPSDQPQWSWAAFLGRDARIQYPMRTRASIDRTLDPTRFYDANDDSEDHATMERRHWPLHEVWGDECQPMSNWQSQSFPTCNHVHAASIRESLVGGDLSLLSAKGYWRHAWKHQEGLLQQEGNKTQSNATHWDETHPITVWKTFKLEHNMEEAFFENSRVDALAMERLTSSPYIISLYAFCGMTVLTEFAGQELSAVAGRLNATQRLELASQVAQGVADIHSIDERPSLAHNDLNLANLVLTTDGRPVWNDFNIAVLLQKHQTTNETCPIVSHFPNPQWRAPEEQVYSEEESTNAPPLVDVSADVYALGNVLYRLAVGTSPWKQPGAKKLSPEEKLTVARLKRENGTTPIVPDYIRNSTNPSIQAMLTAMEATYRYDPATRPSAREVADFLRASLDNITAMTT